MNQKDADYLIQGIAKIMARQGPSFNGSNAASHDQAYQRSNYSGSADASVAKAASSYVKEMQDASKALKKTTDDFTKSFKIKGIIDYNLALGKMQKKINESTNEMDKLIKTYAKSSVAYSSMMRDDLLTSRQLDQALKDLNKAFSDSGGLLTKSFKANAETIADFESKINKLSSELVAFAKTAGEAEEALDKTNSSQADQLKALEESTKKMTDLTESSQSLTDQNEKYKKILENTKAIQEKIAKGEKVKDSEIAEQIQNFKLLNSTINQNGKALNENVEKISKSHTRLSTAGKFLEETMTKHLNTNMLTASTALVALGKAAWDVAAALYKSNRANQSIGMGAQSVGDMGNRVIGAYYKNGISLEEQSALYKENARTISQMGNNYAGFDDVIGRGQDKLARYGVDLKSGAKASGAMMGNAVQLGVNVNDQNSMNKAMDQQANMFNKLRVATGITIDEFTNLQKSLTDSADIQQSLLRVNQKDRFAKMQDYMMEIQRLKTGGLSLEQAKAQVEEQQKIRNSKMTDRFSAANKLVQLSSIVGMGSEGMKARQILMKGDRASSKEKAELNDIYKRMQAKANPLKNSNNYGIENLYDNTFGNTGNPILDSMSHMANEQLMNQNKAITGKQQATGEAHGTLSTASTEINKKIEGMTNVLSGILNKILGVLGAIAAGIFLMNGGGHKIVKMAQKYVGGKLGRGPDIFNPTSLGGPMGGAGGSKYRKYNGKYPIGVGKGRKGRIGAGLGSVVGAAASALGGAEIGGVDVGGGITATNQLLTQILQAIIANGQLLAQGGGAGGPGSVLDDVLGNEGGKGKKGPKPKGKGLKAKGLNFLKGVGGHLLRHGGTYLAVGSGLYDGYNSLKEGGPDKGKKTGQALGSAMGGALGWEGGMAAGAAVGSAFGGVGAIPGAIIGGGLGWLGSSLGSSAGSGIGGWIGGMFDDKGKPKDKASAQKLAALQGIPPGVAANMSPEDILGVTDTMNGSISDAAMMQQGLMVSKTSTVSQPGSSNPAKAEDDGSVLGKAENAVINSFTGFENYFKSSYSVLGEIKDLLSSLNGHASKGAQAQKLGALNGSPYGKYNNGMLIG